MKSLFLILWLAALSMSAGQPVIGHGNWYIMRNQVKFGASNTLVMTSASADTASAWVPAVDSLSKPYITYSLSYYGKATNGDTSEVQFFIDTRYCVNAATGLGCDSLATYAGEHFVYGNQSDVPHHLIDTLTMSNHLAAFFSNTTTEFFIPHANSIRFRAHRKSIASGKTVAYGGITLLGQ